MFKKIFEDFSLKPFLIMSLLTMLALCGCTSVGEKSQIKEEVREAAGLTPVDWVERRRETLEMAKTKLEDIRKDSDRITKAGEKMAGAAKIKTQFKQKTAATKKSLESAESSFVKLEKASAADWEREHQSFTSQMNVLESHFHELRSMVK